MEAFAIPDTKVRVNDAVDVLVSESIDGLTTHALGEDLVEIGRAIDRLEAERLRRLHRFDAEHGGYVDGGGTSMSWLRRSCGMTARAAAYRVHLARTLGQMPATLDSARTGRASFTNVAMIAHLAGDVGVEQVAPYEDILVEAAETFQPRQMRTLTQATRLYIDPDGVLADDNHAHERRWFNCDKTYGDVFIVSGQLDAEGGALLTAAIDALSHGMSRGEERSPGQRRADALVDMAATQLRCGDHRDVHGQRPHLTLTVSAETLRGKVTAGGLSADSISADALDPNTQFAQTLATDTQDAAAPQSGSSAAAELGGVGPIHPETARRIACDAVRTLVTVAAPDAETAWMTIAPVVPLSVGRAARTIPAHIRTALVLRDQGCRFPGCDRPPAWTDGHHIIHWANGGPTELENLVSLCRMHHRRVHEEGWRIYIADGAAVVEPPP